MAEDPWRLVLAQGTSAQGSSRLFSQASFAFFLVLVLLGVFVFGSGAVRDPVGACVCYSSCVLFVCLGLFPLAMLVWKHHPMEKYSFFGGTTFADIALP